MFGAEVGAIVEPDMGVEVIGSGSWKICCARSLIDMYPDAEEAFSCNRSEVGTCHEAGNCIPPCAKV